MDTVFWDVDTQVDFFPPDPKLPFDRAGEIRSIIQRLVEYAQKNENQILSSVTELSEDDPRFSEEPDFDSTFPPHCVEGTPGIEKIEETRFEGSVRIGPEPMDEGELVELAEQPRLTLIKQTIDSFDNPNVEPLVEQIDPFQFAVFGIGLDLGIKSVVEKLVEMKQTVTVIEDATCALTESDRSSLLLDLKNYGVQVIGVEEATSGYIL